MSRVVECALYSMGGQRVGLIDAKIVEGQFTIEKASFKDVPPGRYQLLYRPDDQAAFQRQVIDKMPNGYIVLIGGIEVGATWHRKVKHDRDTQAPA